MSNRYVSEKQRQRIDQMRQAYANGASVFSLAQQYEFLPNTVAQYLGIPIGPHRNPVQKRKRKESLRASSKSRNSKVRAEYRAGASIEELAVKYGVKPSTMALYAGKAAYKYRDDVAKQKQKANAKAHKREWTKRLKWEYRKVGATVPQLMSKYGMTATSICFYIGISPLRYLDKAGQQRYRDSQKRRRARMKERKMAGGGKAGGQAV